MKTIERTVRRTIGILAMSAMIPVAAWAADAPAAARGGVQRPPQQAFDACAGKRAGDAVTFTTPRGDNVAATCREVDGKLAARPDRMRGRGGRGAGFAGPGHRKGGRGMECGMGMGMGPGMGLGLDNSRMAEALNLTAAQKTKIQEVMDEKRQKSEQLHQQLRDGRARLWETASKAPYDEAAVRKLAGEQEKIRTEMIVSRTASMSRIMSLLTPEQKETAARIGIFGNGPDHGRGGGHGPGPGRGAGTGPGMGRGMGNGPGNPDCPWR